jgi:organic hydroperoxide reductase OsmC/OhrA
MSDHYATIVWKRQSPEFTYERYNRGHEWRFDGGVVVPGSSAPAFRGDLERVDPEEAFVASLASCHMLTFLAIAARKRFTIDLYEDEAQGVMTKNDKGRFWVSKVILRPRIVFSGSNKPTEADIAAMHHASHDECFIANSVKTDIVVEGR